MVGKQLGSGLPGRVKYVGVERLWGQAYGSNEHRIRLVLIG
jgi:hypothetical protein